MTKKCSRCKIPKDQDTEFPLRKYRTKIGPDSQCYECRREASKLSNRKKRLSAI